MNRVDIEYFIKKTKIASVATVDNEKPKVRPMDVSVVHGDIILASTFSGSRKLSEMSSNKWIELAWVSRDMSEQLRISGTVRIETDNAIRKTFLLENKSADSMFKDEFDENFILLSIKPSRVEFMGNNSSFYEEITW